MDNIPSNAPCAVEEIAEQTRDRKRGQGTIKVYTSKIKSITKYLFTSPDIPSREEFLELSETELPTSFKFKQEIIEESADSNSRRRKKTTRDVYVRLALPLPSRAYKIIFGWLISDTKLARSKKKPRTKADEVEINEDAAEAEEEQDEGDDSPPDLLRALGSIDDDEEETSAPATTTAQALPSVSPLSTVAVAPKNCDNEVTIATSSIQTCKSALIWLHEVRRMAFKSREEALGLARSTDESMDNMINSMINGYKKVVAEKKSKGIMSITEGKAVISDTGYIDLMKFIGGYSENFVPKTNQEFASATFGAAWLSLQWNLVSRNASVEAIHLEHMRYSGDCLQIRFAKSKGDQTGEGLGNTKHVYANPIQPEICCILSMALYFLSTPRRVPTQQQSPNDTKFFQGSNQKARWAEVLHRILGCLPDAVDLGCAKQDVGTHSIRKGAATFLLSLVNGPSAVQVYLRAGWTLGNVPDRYIHAGAGGDQLVGRTIGLLPLQEAEFGTIGPHFTQEGLNKISEFGWDKLYPGYNELSKTLEGFKSVLHVFVANIAFHFDWLKSNLSTAHPLWQAPLFVRCNDFFMSIKEYAVSGVLRNPSTAVTATGIPGHVSVASALKNVTKQLEALQTSQASMIREIEAMLDEQKEIIPMRLRDMLHEDFDGLGPKAITEEALKSMFRGLQGQMMAMNEKLLSEMNVLKSGIESRPSMGFGAADLHNASGTPAEGGGDFEPVRTYQHYWGQCFRYVCRSDCTHASHKLANADPPANFCFPSNSAKHMFRLWFCGNHKLKVGPYKELHRIRTNRETLKTVHPESASALAKAVKVMSRLEDIAKEQHTQTAGAFKISFETCDYIFDRACEALLKEYNIVDNSTGEGNRVIALQYTTLYNILTKKK